MLNTSYQVEDITPTKRGTGQEGKRRKPKKPYQIGKAIPQGVTTKKKIKWSKTTKKEINKLSKTKLQTSNLIHLMIF